MLYPLKLRLIAGAILVAALEACGGDSTEPAAQATREPRPATIELEAKDFVFAPETLSAAPGSRVTVTVRNTGKAPHTFTASSIGIDQEVDSGKSTEISFTMPATGSVAFVCRFHEAQQMKGVIQAA